jgi:hypothetical protein
MNASHRDGWFAHCECQSQMPRMESSTGVKTTPDLSGTQSSCNSDLALLGMESPTSHEICMMSILQDVDLAVIEVRITSYTVECMLFYVKNDLQKVLVHLFKGDRLMTVEQETYLISPDHLYLSSLMTHPDSHILRTPGLCSLNGQKAGWRAHDVRDHGYVTHMVRLAVYLSTPNLNQFHFVLPFPGERKEGEGTIKSTNVPCVMNKNETEMNNDVQVRLETDQDNQLEAIVIPEQTNTHDVPIKVGHRNPSISTNKIVSGGCKFAIQTKTAGLKSGQSSDSQKLSEKLNCLTSPQFSVSGIENDASRISTKNRTSSTQSPDSPGMSLEVNYKPNIRSEYASKVCLAESPEEPEGLMTLTVMNLWNWSNGLTPIGSVLGLGK